MNGYGKKISLVVIRRLPRYYRYLAELLKQDIKRISSKELSERMNVTASQIRQDLNCFGGFGQQGYGYNVEELYNEIGAILGLRDGHKTIIAGAGHLGHALANHGGFEKRGFKLVAIFDNDKEKIGTTINGVMVYDIADMESYLKENPVTIGILAVPRTCTTEIADLMVKCGIKGLLNFSYMDLKVPENVIVENVHLTDSMMTLSYQLRENKNIGE
ncbi:MAG: redox-sensing transcriptional repressor Rex [Ruminococcaceae bacterium]|nr:redox-sensing transcriptional repressor Rex [Oscillospiraceae bacterium]